MAVIVSDSEVGGVAYAAHLGGAVPGVIWGVCRRYCSGIRS
jgi:membrane associated rhomboid family serine protease